MATPKDKDKINVISKLKSMLKTLPMGSPAAYRNGHWHDIIKLATPTRVITEYTLKEVTEFLVSGGKAELTYVSHYSQDVFGSYVWDGPEEERSKFLVPNDDGGNTAIFAITESVNTIEANVVSVHRLEPPSYKRGEEKPDPNLYWTAVFVEKGYTERNYNAGWDEWSRKVTVTRRGDKTTWS